jgi:S-DNA-T family DNA segregation ATPase FtsK/SpoIIIE
VVVRHLLIFCRHVAGWHYWRFLGGAADAVWGWLRVAGQRVSRCVRRAARGLLRRIGPSLHDVAGWLGYSLPRWILRAPGRLLRWCGRRGLRLVWQNIVLAGFGLWWLLTRLARHVLGYADFGGVLREAERDNLPQRMKRIRAQWRRASFRRLAAVLVAAVLLWQLIQQLNDHFGLPAVALLVVAIVGVLAGVGRVVRGWPEHAAELAQAEDEPFPIADAHTRKEAAECVARAVKAEGIELRSTGEVHRQPWGWEVPVILKRGKPADLIAKVGELETTLDLPAGGLLAAPARSRRACVTLRLAERDPFDSLALAVFREPLSVSIKDTLVVAQRMNGTDLGLCLLGAQGVVIGTTGAGKTVALHTLADAITACRDAIVWDLDPIGNGLDVFGNVIARREHTHHGIESALADAVAICQARPRLFRQLGMPGVWQPSPQYPAIVILVDEYPYLTRTAKALAVDLLGMGRKGRVSLILASREATADTLGDAIADSTVLKIMLPCRHADVRLVLGTNMLAEGWRPDRLNPATGESPEDAGKCYIYAAGARDPVISKIRPLSDEEATERGTHRALAGIPRIDAATWEQSRTIRATEAITSNRTSSRDGVNGQAVQDIIDAFAADDRLWTEDLLARLSAMDGDRYGSWTAETLAATLRPLGVAARGIKRDGRNRNGYYRNMIIAAWWGLS